MAKIFDLSSIKFVKRIVVGQKDPISNFTDEDAQKSQDYINRCLNEFPNGHIIGIEKNFNILNLGEHQVVLQWLVYHIGFEKKPFWMDEK